MPFYPFNLAKEKRFFCDKRKSTNGNYDRAPAKEIRSIYYYDSRYIEVKVLFLFIFYV